MDVWHTKYAVKDRKGAGEKDINAMRDRIALALAKQERTNPQIGDRFSKEQRNKDILANEEELNQDRWRRKFREALDNGAIPAGRITANIGAEEIKGKTSTINCTVSGTIGDSMRSILQRHQEAGLTLKAGCGIGYEFSTLRPSGSYVSGAGARTSGPISFMDIYDVTCGTIASAGGRRGAQMATFNVAHPDIMQLVKAKRENGKLRHFNISVLVDEAFMNAVRNDAQWPLVFPMLKGEEDEIDTSDPEQCVWRKWGGRTGKVPCKIYRTVGARALWDLIMESNYEFAEPGVIFIDRINEWNNNWFCEDIRATNPCGEQALPPYGACLLGSIDLTRFVKTPFEKEASIDWETLKDTVKVFTRMLDNVVEVSGLVLEEQRKEIIRKRRHGMGFLGLGSTLAMLGVRYGSEKAVKLTEEISQTIAIEGWREGVELAKEKGPAPIMNEEFTITEAMMEERPQMAHDGIKVGSKVRGKVLLARYSRYMSRLATEAPEIIEEIERHGARFTHHSSIAPTGTISLALANNASNGIEPTFAHTYTRNVIVEGRKTKEKMEVMSFELLAYRTLVDENAGRGEHGTTLPDTFVSADDVSTEEHIAMQAAAQRWVDSSISKTINVATNCDREKFRAIYEGAYTSGLKGCTTFRYNPEVFQGVLVRNEDLAKTMYRFRTKGGETIEVRGDEEVTYEGETHSGANLFDALKEGNYGRM